MAYLYRHIRIDKNEPFYIGIGSDLKYKRAFDFTQKHRNNIWYKIFKKTKIEVEIVFDNLSFEEVKVKEIEFISIYKRIIDGGILSNITLGGDGCLGLKHPELSKRNKTGIWLGKKHTDESKNKIRKNHIGVVFSDIHKMNISKSKIGVYNDIKNPNYRGKIYCYKDNVFIGEFESLKDIQKKLYKHIGNISSVLTGRLKLAGGYYFTRIKN